MNHFEQKAREIVNSISPFFEDDQHIQNLVSAISFALEEAVRQEREACAARADYWGKGNLIVQNEGARSRYTLRDFQTYTNVAGRGIAEDIRSRGKEESNA